VLLALAYRKHTSHRAAAEWLGHIDDAAGVVVCRHTQLGLLRLLSTRAVMGDDVLDAPGCWAVFDLALADQRFAFLREPREIDTAFRHLVRKAASSPKLWQDAYLAAFAIAGGLSFVTFDAGFKQFGELNLILLDSAP
jgi:toxin-antitoxin system PIN domain toxin